MQPSALRAVWALQNARGSLPTAIQQAFALLSHASIPGDGKPSSTSLTPSPSLHTTWRGITLTSSLELADAASATPTFSAWAPAPPVYGGRRHASTLPSAQQHQPAVPSPASTSSSTAAGAYAIEIAVQGFEKRYVDMASNAIDDLLMLAFAPKALAALPTGSPDPADAPLALAFGAIRRRDVRLPWRRTRFTLLRSPHIDKQGMEQFERREYKTVLAAATNSDEELRRLLEALKIYQFTGVQIRVDVTSAQRLELPNDVRRLLGGAAATAGGGEAAAAGGQVLGSPVVTLPAPRSPEALFQEELSAVLRVLRPLVWTGLQSRRSALDAVPEFSAWRLRAAKAAAAATAGQRPVASALLSAKSEAEEADLDAEGSGGDTYGRLLRQRMQQQLELLRAEAAGAKAQAEEEEAPAAPASAAAGPASAQAAAAAYGLDPAVAAELLARIDSELLNAHKAALQGQPPPPSPSAGGTAAGPMALDASKMSPAEYAYAVLKYVQYVDALCGGAAAPQEAAARGSTDAETAARRRADADAALQLSAPSLALRLLQLWCAATSIEFKQALGLPPAEVEKQILEEQLRREEMARAAAALSAARPAAAAAPPPPPPAAEAAAAARAGGAPSDKQEQQAAGRGQRPGGRQGQGQGRREDSGQGRGGQDRRGQQQRRGPGGQGQPA